MAFVGPGKRKNFSSSRSLKKKCGANPNPSFREYIAVVIAVIVMLFVTGLLCDGRLVEVVQVGYLSGSNRHVVVSVVSLLYYLFF